MIVVPADAEAAERLAELHLQTFSRDDHLAAAFGPAFVRALYRWFTASPDTFVLAARDARSGALLGFTSVADRPYTGPMLRACWREAIGGVLRDPRVLLHPDLRARVAGLIRGATQRAGGPDLTGVGQIAFTLVVPEARGRGVGSALKRASIEVARERGLRGLVTGIRADNAASQRMNRAAGFVEVPELRRGSMLGYLLRFSPGDGGGAEERGGPRSAEDRSVAERDAENA